MQKKPVFYTRLIARSGVTAVSMLLLAAGLLFASCANAVNSRGGPVDAGGGSSGSSGSSGASSGSNTTRNVRGGGNWRKRRQH